MRRISVALALALVAVFTASTLTLHAQGFAVRGTIQEFGSTIGTRPLAGATVSLSPGGYSAATDANGFYAIGSVPLGSYAIRVIAPGHQSLETRITVSSDLVLNYVLQVAETLEYDLRGTVTESGSFGTRPLAGAVVTVRPGGRSTTTDANGRYAIDNLAVGTYTVTASASGHRTVTRSIPMRTDAEVGIDLPVSTGSNNGDTSRGMRGVSGVILDSDGRAISGATIRLTPGNYVTTTDSEGRFTLPSIRNGTYMLHLRAPGYPAMNRKVTIGSDRTITLTMNKGRSGKVSRDNDDADGHRDDHMDRTEHKGGTVDRDDDDDDDDDDRMEKKEKKSGKAKKASKGKGMGHK